MTENFHFELLAKKEREHKEKTYFKSTYLFF